MNLNDSIYSANNGFTVTNAAGGVEIERNDAHFNKAAACIKALQEGKHRYRNFSQVLDGAAGGGDVKEAAAGSPKTPVAVEIEKSCLSPTMKKVLTIALLVVGVAMILTGVGAGLGVVFALAGGCKVLAAVGFTIAAATGLKVAVIGKIALAILAAGITAAVVAIKKLRAQPQVEVERYNIDKLIKDRKDNVDEELVNIEKEAIVTNTSSGHHEEFEDVLKNKIERQKSEKEKMRVAKTFKTQDATTDVGVGLDDAGVYMQRTFGA